MCPWKQYQKITQLIPNIYVRKIFTVKLRFLVLFKWRINEIRVVRNIYMCVLEAIEFDYFYPHIASIWPKSVEMLINIFFHFVVMVVSNRLPKKVSSLFKGLLTPNFKQKLKWLLPFPPKVVGFGNLMVVKIILW